MGVHASRQEGLEENDDGNVPSQRKMSFAGASLFTKYQWLNLGSVVSATAVFVESGVGRRGEASMTRSVRPKAGFMQVLSLGVGHKLSADLNAGSRYRQVEAVGDYQFRNEMFYGALTRLTIVPSLQVFASIGGRRIMARDPEVMSDFAPEYERGYAVGLSMPMKSWEISSQWAAPIGAAKFGQGKNSVLAGVTYQIAGRKTAIGSNSEVGSATSEVSVPVEDRGMNGLESADMEKDINYITDQQRTKEGHELDEFELAGKKMPKGSKNNQVEEISDEEKVTRELEQLQQVEIKKKEFDERRNKFVEKKSLRQEKAQLESEQVDYYEFRKDMGKDLDVLPRINDEDVRWNGLE
jgi:hypothetical protein